MASTTERETSSKVYLRYFDTNKYYETEKTLPVILDSEKNGGRLYAMNQTEWDEFCDKIDTCFRQVNMLQSLVFFSKILIMAMMVVYVFIVYITFWRVSLPFIYFLLCLLGFLLLFNCLVQSVVNDRAVKQAKLVCQEQQTNLNLKAGYEFAIQIKLHHMPWKPFIICQPYEVDSKERARSVRTYMLICRGSTDRSRGSADTSQATLPSGGTIELPAIVSVYAGSDSEYRTTNRTAPNSDMFADAKSDIENKYVPTAYCLTEAQMEPARATIATLEPYVSVPMVKAVIQDSEAKPVAKPKLQPKKEEPKSEEPKYKPYV